MFKNTYFYYTFGKMVSISFVSIDRSIIRLIEAFRIINSAQISHETDSNEANSWYKGVSITSIEKVEEGIEEEIEESYSLK